MELICHPDHPARAISGIAVSAARDGQRLRLAFAVAGDTAGLRIAPGEGRTDGLWRHTCFEAFVGAAGPAYHEFNLAPSGAWAAYAFDDYRDGMRELDAGPDGRWDGRTMAAAVPVAVPGNWRLNLTAVIEEADGTRSFWALAHPAGPPDFHNPACFVLTLPAPRDP